MADYLRAPEPQRPFERKRPAVLDMTSSSLHTTPSSTPMNTAFVASPTGFQGGQSPFYADATPIAAAPNGSPTSMSDFGWFAQHPMQSHTHKARTFSMKSETVPEDSEPIFAGLNPDRARELGA